MCDQSLRDNPSEGIPESVYCFQDTICFLMQKIDDPQKLQRLADYVSHLYCEE